MLSGEWHADTAVVAGDVIVHRDLLANMLGARAARVDSVGDARLVVLCPNGDGQQEVDSLAEDPERAIVVVGVAERDALPYYEAGAWGVLPPEASPDEVRSAVALIARGEAVIPPRAGRLILDRIQERGAERRAALEQTLTSRQLEVAWLIAERCANKEIASRLHITTATVKAHVTQVLRKLHANTRREVALRLREHQLSYDPPPQRS
jgi:DNA-binding NarL/FixJ family response regulator